MAERLPLLYRAFRPSALGGLPNRKKWYEKDEEELVGGEEGMFAPEVGMRVRLSQACLGQGVKGEDGSGTIQWVGNSKTVCHVKWEGNPRFDYSYCR